MVEFSSATSCLEEEHSGVASVVGDVRPTSSLGLTVCECERGKKREERSRQEEKQRKARRSRSRGPGEGGMTMVIIEALGRCWPCVCSATAAQMLASP